MDCDKANGRMYHYLDGEVTVWRRWRITRHLDRCPPCASGYDFEIEFREVIATRCRETAPDEVRQRIIAALEAACREHEASADAEARPPTSADAAGRGIE
jgi:mycothiol system anti-sigma-R factor